MTVVVPDLDSGTVSLLKPGELEEQEIVDAEFVDEPAPAVDSWMAERRARMAAAPAVVPRWLKDRGEFVDASSFIARYYARQAGFYALRTPVYTGRLWLRAPVGAGRATKVWWEWVRDVEMRPVVSHAAKAKDQTALALSERVADHTALRLRQSAMVAIPAAVIIYLGYFLLPVAVLGLFAAAVLSLLGWCGRTSDRPIVHRYVAVKLQRRLDSSEVEQALQAIGVKGRIDWANPIATDGPGWLAELDLPGATTAAMVLEKREKLAAAMRRPISTVWPEGDRAAHPGRLRIWVAREDPAKAARRLWPLMRQGQADVFGPLPFGFDPRGNLVTITLMYSNLLVGGIPGSGKTSCALAIVLGVALDPTAELWIYELKGSGDLDSVRPVCHRYVSGDEDEDLEAALDGLRAGIVEQKRRAAFIKSLPAHETAEGRRVTRDLAEKYPEQKLGPRVIVVDEAQELFTSEQHKDEAADLCTRLIKKGRAYGVILILLTQNPDAPSLPSSVSSSVGTRLCLAVMDWRANNNVLGTGANERGLRAMDISVSEQGTGILARGREGLTVRAAFIKQTEADAIGKRALALRMAAGTLSGEAAGEAVETVDAESLLDHLRAVWPAGEETMHSHRLVEALAAYRPETYGGWLEADPAGRSTMLAAALKPYGVSTRQVQKRGAGGSAKGLRWEDVQKAASGTRELEPV